MTASNARTRDVCFARPDHTIEDAAWMMLAIDAGEHNRCAEERGRGM